MMSAFRRHWAAWIGAGVFGLLIGIGIGSGNTTTKVVTTTVSKLQVLTDTVVHTVHKVRTVTAAAPAPKPVAAPVSDSGLTFSGDGQKNVGTITVPVDSIMRWHASGGFFGITNDINDADSIDVSSQAGSGETAIAAGSYHKVDILSTGSWGFTITPQH